MRTSERELAVPWDNNRPGVKAVGQQGVAVAVIQSWVWPAEGVGEVSQRECGRERGGRRGPRWLMPVAAARRSFVHSGHETRQTGAVGKVGSLLCVLN